MQDASRGFLIETLRISVTDRCGYHCAYCRPEPLPGLDPAERLTLADYQRLAPIFAALGIRRVRFTGGEPLLRRDLEPIAEAFHRAMPRGELALTTNGQLLPERIDSLLAAGISRVTVHVDSLREDRYRTLMGAADVGAVLEAVLALHAAGAVVKLNAVIARGRNDDEIGDFIEWSKRTGVEVRFIELMDTGVARPLLAKAYVRGREILEAIAAQYGASEVPPDRPSAPARSWMTACGVRFGIIASDSEPFCGLCDRIRLTASGQLRRCLYEPRGPSLRVALAGMDDAALTRWLEGRIAEKASHHPALQSPDALPATPAFSMSSIGG